MPTEGSVSPAVLPGMGRTEKVMPLFSETTTACVPPQFLFGTYTVPSGATLMWPCNPPHWVRLYIGTAAPNVCPPLSLRAI
jgi:hypothetical protein